MQISKYCLYGVVDTLVNVSQDILEKHPIDKGK